MIMMDLHSVTYHIAKELSEDLGRRDLRKRAGTALDEAIAGKDLREIAIDYIIETARGIARLNAAKVEREASFRRQAVERDTRHIQFTREQHESGTCHGCQLCSTEGHWGGSTPGQLDGLYGGRKVNQCRECERCSRAWAEYDELDRKRVERITEATERYEAELREELFIEWTTELLGTEIAMPDGSRTTWGEATIEQHRRRHQMLRSNAMTNMENAARHTFAIQLLEKTGARNLNNAVMEVT